MSETIIPTFSTDGFIPKANAGPSVVTAAVEPEPKKKRATRGGKTTKRRKNIPIYFDLETIPDLDSERYEFFELEELPKKREPGIDSNNEPPEELLKHSVPDINRVLIADYPSASYLRDVRAAEVAGKGRKGVIDGIDALISEQENYGSKCDEITAANIKTMSVTPEYCKIAAFGWAIGDGDLQSMVIGDGDTTEEKILAAFWSLVAEYKPFVGYNVLGFDLPVIFVRSAILEVDSPLVLDQKPWGDDVVDVMKKRYPTGRAMKLKTLCRLYGVEPLIEDVDGSAVFDLMQAKDFATVGEYVRSDVHVVRELYKKFTGLFF